MRRFDHSAVAYVAELFRARRISLGYSRNALAKHAGVSQEAIVKLEAGARVPSLGLVCKVGDAIGLKLAIVEAYPGLPVATQAMRAAIAGNRGIRP